MNFRDKEWLKGGYGLWKNVFFQIDSKIPFDFFLFFESRPEGSCNIRNYVSWIFLWLSFWLYFLTVNHFISSLSIRLYQLTLRHPQHDIVDSQKWKSSHRCVSSKVKNLEGNDLDYFHEVDGKIKTKNILNHLIHRPFKLKEKIFLWGYTTKDSDFKQIVISYEHLFNKKCSLLITISEKKNSSLRTQNEWQLFESLTVFNWWRRLSLYDWSDSILENTVGTGIF